jgi:hypothetical protein
MKFLWEPNEEHEILGLRETAKRNAVWVCVESRAQLTRFEAILLPTSLTLCKPPV